MNTQILIAGFGGQGVLFIGKFFAYAGLMEGKNVSWLPSYGPEMRGGTANCSVIISDGSIGSPIITEPDILIAMNLPSLAKYEGMVKKGGYIFADSSLISRKTVRDDVKFFGVEATRLAEEGGLSGLATMIMAGKTIKETGCFEFESIDKALTKVVSARHADRLESNKTAVMTGYER